MGSHASQHRISVPKCLSLWARNAVEAVKNLAPRLPGVLRESSRTVCPFCLFEENFEVCECAKWSSRVLVIVINPLQK